MRSATIYATGACNLRCKHCFVGHDQMSPREELSTDEIKSVITNLSLSGVKNITLIGGEVSVFRRDLASIIDYCDEQGINVSINTNLTEGNTIFTLLKKRSLHKIVVSLDGASSETHDKMRGRGAFSKTMANLDNLLPILKRYNEKSCDITFVLSNLNWEDRFKIIDLAVKKGINQLNINFLKEVGRAKDNEDVVKISAKKIVDAVFEIFVYWLNVGKSLKLDMFIPPAYAEYIKQTYKLDITRFSNYEACGGPYNVYGYVDLKGNHLPCPAMSYEESQGKFSSKIAEELHIVNRKAKDIWETSVFKEFEETRLSKKRNSYMFPCKVCKFNNICSPCTADVIKGIDNPSASLCGPLYRYLEEQGNIDSVFGTAEKIPNIDIV